MNAVLFVDTTVPIYARRVRTRCEIRAANSSRSSVRSRPDS